MTEAFVGLGSNLGDRAANVRRAVDLLAASAGIGSVSLSSLYESDPIGKVDQARFVNAVARLETDRSPRELLAACLDVERTMKRVRVERWGPRLIDLDVLLYGSERRDEDGLTVPHPRLTERAFVLLPLIELDAGIVVDGRPAAEWLAELPDQGVRRLSGR